MLGDNSEFGSVNPLWIANLTGFPNPRLNHVGVKTKQIAWQGFGPSGSKWLLEETLENADEFNGDVAELLESVANHNRSDYRLPGLPSKRARDVRLCLV